MDMNCPSVGWLYSFIAAVVWYRVEEGKEYQGWKVWALSCDLLCDPGRQRWLASQPPCWVRVVSLQLSVGTERVNNRAALRHGSSKGHKDWQTPMLQLHRKTDIERPTSEKGQELCTMTVMGFEGPGITYDLPALIDLFFKCSDSGLSCLRGKSF